MLAIRRKMDRTSYQAAAGVCDRPRPTRDSEYVAGVEGVIYYTPDGDGYVLYTRSRPSNYDTGTAGLGQRAAA